MLKNYILIGSVPNSQPNSFGGTTILMKQMLDYFEEVNKPYCFIKANKYEGPLSLARNFFHIIISLIRERKNCDIVMMNVARNGAFLISPFVYLIAKFYKKKFVFRMFGGNFISLYNNYSIRKIIAAHTFMKADIMFFETKEILEFAKKYNKNVFWFPNTRKVQNTGMENGRNYLKRFVFISSVKMSKGIDEIISAANLLDSSYTIDIYGPIQDVKYTSEYFISKRVNYKGPVNPSEVINVLSNYDVLLLPSFHPGEGYPGIILEAYSLGIPCISTRWGAIPEIVDHNETGLLIEPKNAEELISAMKIFNSDNYSSFSRNSLEKFKLFNYKNVYLKITSICEN